MFWARGVVDDALVGFVYKNSLRLFLEKTDDFEPALNRDIRDMAQFKTAQKSPHMIVCSNREVIGEVKFAKAYEVTAERCKIIMY